jgi:hypothetical protein
MEERESDIERRKRNKRNKIGLDVYIMTAVVSSLLFITGLALGLAFNAEKIDILDVEINNMRNSVENIELEFLFLDMMEANISCSYFIGEANRLAVEASDLGNRVDLYEQTERWEDPNYYTLKSRYMLVNVRNWLMLEKIKRVCEGNYQTVLYFYGDNCAECATQGFVLTYFKEIYGQRLMIFSLDTSLDVPIVEALRLSYNVTEYPSLVINNKIYSGFTNTSEIESVLSLNNLIS